MSSGQCAMRKRNWDGSMLDYGVVFCDTQRWLSCLYAATPIDAISDTIDDLLKLIMRLVVSLFHMSWMRYMVFHRPRPMWSSALHLR